MRSSLEKRFWLLWLAVKGPPLVEEFRFCTTRLWRFDFAAPSAMVAVELEGGVFLNGRHSRGVGLMKDCEKYREAAYLGWLLFRFTGAQLVIPEVERLATFVRVRTVERRDLQIGSP